MEKQGIIALLSDFGSIDGYVGTMKGMILGINRDVTLVDISHEVPPFEVLPASYLLYNSWDYFPEGTVFLAVVDPGVGSDRDIIIGRSGGRFLVAPDNGIVSLLALRKEDLEVFSVKQEILNELSSKRPSWSHTFDGRDIFAPLAAMLAAGDFKDFIDNKVDPVTLADLECNKEVKGDFIRIKGKIIHIDRFGNCVSSIHVDDVRKPDSPLTPLSLSFRLPGCEIPVMGTLSSTFRDVGPGEHLWYAGSAGFFELGIREWNAAKTLGIKLRDTVIVEKD